MKRHVFVMLLISLFTATVVSAQTGDCTQYTYNWGGTPSNPSNTTGHSHGGNHHGASTVEGSCSYTGANVSGWCSVKCSSTYVAQGSDSEDISLPNTYHEINWNGSYGVSTSQGGWVGNPPTATCGGQVQYGVRACLGSSGCNLTVTVNAGGNGLGATVSYSAPTIWTSPTYVVSNTCNSYLSPGCNPNLVPEPQPPPYGSGNWVWNPGDCAWVYQTSASPIIIDTDGSGFHLTNAADGIKWDFFGNGRPIQIAWTAAASTNGWLAIDLNGNGTIDSAKELFGNISAQPANPSDPNAPDGFNDLSQYDSNGDGVIDKNDPVWSQLLVWIDSNHDGISQSNELHNLDSLGIHSISTSYTVSPRTDQYGNQFHLKGTLNPGQNDQGVSPVIYDVYLTQ